METTDESILADVSLHRRLYNPVWQQKWLAWDTRWNLAFLELAHRVTAAEWHAAEALRDQGRTPYEAWQHIHPTQRRRAA